MITVGMVIAIEGSAVTEGIAVAARKEVGFGGWQRSDSKSCLLN